MCELDKTPYDLQPTIELDGKKIAESITQFVENEKSRLQYW